MSAPKMPAITSKGKARIAACLSSDMIVLLFS
jgi:hypothetical protein